MACIKTGTWVWLQNYGWRACCDVYRVGGCYIFRWIDSSILYEDPEDNDWEVPLIQDPALWFHREDLGITTVPMHLVVPGDM